MILTGASNISSLSAVLENERSLAFVQRVRCLLAKYLSKQVSNQSISEFVLILTIRKLNSIRAFLSVGRIPCLDLSKMTPHLWLLMVSFSLHWPEVPEGSSASLSSASGGHSSMSSGTYHTGLKASCENSKVKCLIAVF